MGWYLYYKIKQFIFTNNYASISGTNYNKYNKSNYFNTTTKESYGTLDINQLGAVLVFNSNSKENNDWNKIAIALNYEDTNNFDNNIFSAGINPNNSIGNYFIKMGIQFKSRIGGTISVQEKRNVFHGLN